MFRNRWDDMEPDVFEIEDRRIREYDDRVRAVYGSTAEYFPIDEGYEDEDDE